MVCCKLTVRLHHRSLKMCPSSNGNLKFVSSVCILLSKYSLIWGSSNQQPLVNHFVSNYQVSLLKIQLLIQHLSKHLILSLPNDVIENRPDLNNAF